MPSTVTVGTFDSENVSDVARILKEFDSDAASQLPELRRRQLFSYSDLYVHMQDWDVADTAEA